MRTLLVGSLLVVGCTGDTVGAISQPAIATNAIATNAIATNAIATNAIATNAIATNAIATNAVTRRGILVGTIADPDVALALEDPNARVFLRYLVSCAFTPGQAVTWTSRDRQLRETYHGALGLCPEWQKGAPDLACRERVSACILARNNAFGVSVAFSLRGMSDWNQPLALGTSVPPHDHAAGTNTVVDSTLPCAGQTFGARRDCGWTVAALGACEPRSAVSIATGNYAACSGEWLGVPGQVDNMLRVCAGTHACDAATAIASVDNACKTADPAIDFACPASGFYAVMTAAVDSEQTSDGEVSSTRAASPTCERLACIADAKCCKRWSGHCESVAETACRFPASEAQVFRWREGSFYGDLFGEDNLDPAKPQIRVHPETLRVQSLSGGTWIDDGGALSHGFVGVVFPSMFACASSNWVEPEAYVQHRVCAGPDPTSGRYTRNCAAQYAGACASQCAVLDAAPIDGDHDAAACAGGGRVFQMPMTTLLAGPCDALPGSPYCATVLPTPILTW